MIMVFMVMNILIMMIINYDGAGQASRERLTCDDFVWMNMITIMNMMTIMIVNYD